MKVIQLSLVSLLICSFELARPVQGWKQISPNFTRVEEIQALQANCQHGDENDHCPAPPPPMPTFERWVSAPVKELHDGLFRSIFDTLISQGIYFNENEGRAQSPFNFRQPEDLLKSFDLTLGEEAASDEKMARIVKDILEFSPRSAHPFNVHRRSTGLDPYGIAADWIVTAMSSPLVTYLVAPIFTLAELELLREFRKLIGYPKGELMGDHGDGIGTIYPNGFAVQVALQQKFPDPMNETDTRRGYKEHGILGLGAPHPVIFISENADFSFEKQAAAQGIGTHSIIRVKADSNDRMDIGALRQAIEHSRSKNQVPIMVVGTAGTPILGAIDDLEEIAKVAQENNIWFHVDGTLGAALIFSQSKAQLIKGIEKSDSLSWSAHGLLGAPVETGVFVTRHENICKLHFGIANAAYVYNTTNLNENKWDIGDNTVQTCRRSFTFDIWYMWKAKGLDGFSKHIDYIFENSKFACEQIGQMENFRLVLPSFDLPQISFYYIPSHLRGADPKSVEFIRGTSNATETIKNQLLLDGNVQLSTSISSNLDEPIYFTVKLTNSALNRADIMSLLNQIEGCGSQLFEKNLKNCARMGQIPAASSNYPHFVSSPVHSMHGSFHREVANMILEKGLYFQDKRGEPPVNYKNPEDLAKIISFNLTNAGTPDQTELLDILDKVIEFSPHQSHPFWIYQLSAGMDPYTLMGDFVQGVVSSPSNTYEDNPLFALMERETTRAILNMLNWPQGDVIFAAGGTMANIFGLHFPRFAKNPLIKRDGFPVDRKQMRVYYSQECHYSLLKGAFFLGFGRENGVLISSEHNGRMNMTELRMVIEKDIADGKQPIMVAATAGTTVLGAIDPINEVIDLCEEFGLWSHVDGAFGGSIFFSKDPAIRNRLNGLERADSFSFNPAKMYGATQLMNLLVVKNGKISQNANALGHPIDFKSNAGLYNPEFDTGDKYLQRQRRSTAVKMWFMMKAKGLKGLSAHINQAVSNVEFCLKEMNSRPGFVPALDQFELTNVLFMYIPKRLRNMDRNSREFFNEMELVAFDLQASLVAEGVVVVVAQRHRSNSPLHLKFVLMSSALAPTDLKYLIDEVDRIGRNL